MLDPASPGSHDALKPPRSPPRVQQLLENGGARREQLPGFPLAGLDGPRLPRHDAGGPVGAALRLRLLP
eukprot:10012779-Lingulodinium_polyedra.AAC.1